MKLPFAQLCQFCPKAGVFPAHAGMSPVIDGSLDEDGCFLRASGDEPTWKAHGRIVRKFSPRERG